MVTPANHCTAAPDFHFGASCCAAHDADYTAGEKTRAQADADLLACIVAAGAPWRGMAYFLAVRAAGWFFWRRKERRRNAQPESHSAA